ncbi:hypothetical protein [Pseudomonas anguilliseptica]|uniref:Uncharacterized protein n=1 Tax=Pseudomonas anguilliseptica TaxID=53406 RepID=A0A1H5FAC6_PSEAG|nr:hypothetical protein [Pseudomonas anguilliseptica]SEE00088.1 hypothetical protein SAMN05421553_3814 [Pseudomonas anguilliseptica]
MPNRLDKPQKLVYVAAVPAIQARAGYCVTAPVTQSYGGAGASVQPTTTMTYSYVVSDSLAGPGPGGGSWLANRPSGQSSYKIAGYQGDGYSAYRPAQVPVKTCYPTIVGQAGSPARTNAFDNFGWNAGARSVEPIPESGFIAATMPPSPIGVQLGLTGPSPAYYYGEMAHSLVVRHDELTVVERGNVVAGPFTVPPSVAVKVQRTAGVVSYWANGIVLYTSEQASAGEAYGGAMLFSTIDYVDSPSIGEVTIPLSFSGLIPAFASAISESTYDFALAELPALRLTAVLDEVQGVSNFSVELPGLILAVSESAAVSWVRGSLPALSVQAELVNAETTPDSFIGLTAPLTLTASLRDGGSIYFAGDISLALAVSETSSIVKVDALLPIRMGLAVVEPYLPADTADGSDASILADWSSIETALLLIAMESLDVSGQASIVMVLELAGMDSLGVGEHASFGSIVELLAMEQVAVMSHASSARQQALQYAVNYMTGALTSYQDFDFAGFTHSGGRAFAWNANGLYRLGADRDNGEVINALVDFGATDYGDSHVKRAETAFVGVRTDGECYVRLTADDDIERVYRLIGGGNQKRSLLAKGVSSRYWNVRLELTSASFATLDSVELEVGVTQRRSFNRRS